MHANAYVSCGVNLYVIFHSSPLILPAKPRAGTSNLSLSCSPQRLGNEFYKIILCVQNPVFVDLMLVHSQSVLGGAVILQSS